MFRSLLMSGVFTTMLGVAQVPPAPNTIPKPPNDPTNTNNITTDPTSPAGTPNISGNNPGLGSNPGAGVTDQLREASDQNFANAVAQQSITEVELGKLVATKSTNDSVKAYAVEMTQHNARVNERLKRVAARSGVNISATLDAKSQARIDKLTKLNGTEFDRAFLKDQIQSGDRNVRAYDQELQNGSDVGLKTLATRSMPALQKQLQAAKDLEKALKNK